MKERAFFISSWQYKICRQILREQELGTFIKYYKISQLIHTQSIAN